MSQRKRLEMWVRTRVPNPLRGFYRLARAGFGDVSAAPEIPKALVDGGRLFASRADLIGALPKGGKVAELGTYKGDFARIILDLVAPSELHVVDIEPTHFDRRLLDDARVALHVGLTYDVISRFADGSFDWIYVDAEHGFRAVLRDARAAAAKVRPGGFLVFNDFAHIDPWLGRYGVHRAVATFAIEAQWRVWALALQPAGLYDIALQRPANLAGDGG